MIVVWSMRLRIKPWVAALRCLCFPHEITTCTSTDVRSQMKRPRISLQYHIARPCLTSRRTFYLLSVADEVITMRVDQTRYPASRPSTEDGVGTQYSTLVFTKERTSIHICDHRYLMAAHTWWELLAFSWSCLLCLDRGPGRRACIMSL